VHLENKLFPALGSLCTRIHYVSGSTEISYWHLTALFIPCAKPLAHQHAAD